MRYVSALALVAVVACGARDGENQGSDNGAFSSAQATLVDFTFDGELLGPSASNLKGQIRAQLLYSVGHLNAEPGVAQLGKVVLSNITATAQGSLYRVRYHAQLPVAWGNKGNVPSSYALTLPHRIDSAGQNAFTSAYAPTCSDEPSAANVDNFWYHYRPHLSGCTIAPADVVTLNAKVTPSAKNTTGKYPEYDRVWDDGILRIVAVFGKYDDGATSDFDAGIAAYNAFTAALESELQGATTTPALTGSPGAAIPQVTFDLARPDGTRVEATLILVNKLATEGASFDKRYSELTPGADLIVYDGHAGLGANVQSLAQRGRFFPHKYQIFFMNGCDTFAYMDDTLATKRGVLNTDDPSGTKYMDMVTNAMPAFFNSMPDASMAMIRALLAPTAPRTYDSIFTDIDSAQIVVVTGEEDNAFEPGAPTTPSWSFDNAGAVGKAETVSLETDTLPAGSYVFSLLPEPSIAGGDADLRIRVGAPPTITPTYKCPSYLYNSNELCELTLNEPGKIFIAVTGDSSAMKSPFELRAFARR
jgi:hypothetical protein